MAIPSGAAYRDTMRVTTIGGRGYLYAFVVLQRSKMTGRKGYLVVVPRATLNGVRLGNTCLHIGFRYRKYMTVIATNAGGSSVV